MLLASWLADRPISVNEMWRESMAWSEMHPIPWYVATGEYYPDPDITLRYRPQVHAVLASRELRQRMMPLYGLASGEDVFVKTHSCVAEIRGVPTINAEVSKGAVYVVRDPRDVAVSYAHHYGLDMDTAINRLADPLYEIRNSGHNAFQYPGTWSDNVQSWAGIEQCLVIRYEDMQTDTRQVLADTLKYLGLPRKGARIARAVENSRFARLSAEETSSGFIEKVRGRFFREGKAGGWVQALTAEQVLRIESAHAEVMKQHGYSPRISLH